MNAGKKKQGRFIKNDDPIRKVLTITDFSLSEICESPYTSADNANANIIHEKLHHPEELELGVRNSSEIEVEFPPTEERLVIRPLDFTDEWRRQKKRQANRQSRSDEDDDFDIFNQNQENEEEEPVRAPAATPVPPPVMEVKEPAPVAPPIAAAAPAPTPAAPIERPIAAPAPTPVAAPAPAAAKSDFVPYMAQGEAITIERPSEEELEAIREAARNEGYRQGYKLGEEKATLESRQKVQTILSEVNTIIEQLQGMQRSILGHVQDNFQTICQSLIEALLQREFKMNPDSFSAIVERAIEEAIPEDEYRIFVSPTVAKELHTWQDKKLAQNIRGDDALQGYHFRIEGKNATVDADLRKIIGDLLDQADLSLFEEKEKAS